MAESADETFKQFAFRISEAFRGVERTFGMPGFIVALCSIDWMASFYFGCDPKGWEYKQFVRTFLRRYNANSIYHDLRCGLVHNYTDRGSKFKYDFREDRSQHHLTMRPDSANPAVMLKVINLSNFVSDLRDALNAMLVKAAQDPIIMERIVKRFRTMGLITGDRETL